MARPPPGAACRRTSHRGARGAARDMSILTLPQVPAASPGVAALRRGWMRLERGVDAACGTAGNPLRHLGAIGFSLFWLLAASGIYLYAAIDTSAGGAWTSIDRLSREQPYLGGLLRSLHRYTADAFAVVMLVHLAREALFGRFRGFRRFSWLTGVAVLPLAFPRGPRSGVAPPRSHRRVPRRSPPPPSHATPPPHR